MELSEEDVAKLLQSTRIMDRVRGARYASKFDQSFVNQLQNLLNDQFYECRSQAALSLGIIRSYPSLPALFTLLSDEVEEVRFSSAEALGYFQDSRVILPLLHVLKDYSREAKRQAMISLSRQELDDVIDKMMAWLNDLEEIDYEMRDELGVRSQKGAGSLVSGYTVSGR